MHFLKRFTYLFGGERVCGGGRGQRDSQADSALSVEPDLGLDLRS